MDREEFLKLSQPIHATEREADLFALANHYRQMLERILDQTSERRVLYSDSLARNISSGMFMAPARLLLSFQTTSMKRAPRDGGAIVVTVDEPIPFAVAVYRERVRHNWEDARTGRLLTPTSYVPIYLQSSREEDANG